MRSAVAIAERVETHFVGTPIQAGLPNSSIAVNSSPASARLHTASTSRLMVGLSGQQLEHVIADVGPNTEDPLELVGRGAVDREPPVAEVGDLDERVGSLDNVGQEFPLGEGGVDSPLQRVVQLAAVHARQEPCRVVSQTAQNIPATWPCSSRTGEYEKVNQVCSSNPLRFMTSGRSSR